jgi:hypothetical protein
VICANAFAAKDTLAQVPDDKRIGLLKSPIMGHGIKPCNSDTQIRSDLPQLAPISLATHNTGLGMIGHHQAHNIGTVPSHCVGIGLDRHVLRYRGDTRGHHSPTLLILHQADAAGTGRGQVTMMAEGGNLDPVFRGGIQKAHPKAGTDALPVHGQGDLFQVPFLLSKIAARLYGRFHSAIYYILLKVLQSPGLKKGITEKATEIAGGAASLNGKVRIS